MMDLPKALEVQDFVNARAPEVESLLEQLRLARGATFGAPALTRHLRRRASSHNRYNAKRRPNFKLALMHGNKRLRLHGQERPMNRSMRRRVIKSDCFLTSQESCPSDENSKPQKLESHMWHARRMQMHKRWGISLAAQSVGRGHGSRSFLHHLRHGAVIHDASYWSCVSLQSPIQVLDSLLKLVGDPDLVSEALSCDDFLLGAVEWSMILHNPGKFPLGAIGPVRAMIVPPSTPLSSINDAKGDVSGELHDAPLAITLWLWVHAASHTEALAALETACVSVDCKAKPKLLSLRRLEVLGPQSEAALMSVLKPIGAEATDDKSLETSDGNRSNLSANIWSAVQCQRELGPGGHRWQWRWPGSCTLGMEVIDPRLAALIRVGGFSIPLPGLPSQAQPLPSTQLEKQMRNWPRGKSWSSDVAAQLMSRGVDETSPLPSQAVSQARAQSRSAVMGEVLPILTGRSGEISTTSALTSLRGLHSGPEATTSSLPFPPRTSFPALLVRQRFVSHGDGLSAISPRWSLILPKGWVMPIWTALAFQGLRPCGQLEWRWTASLAQAPCFPYDFPHTASGASWLQAERQKNASLASRRPLGRARKVTSAAAYVPWAKALGSHITAVSEAGHLGSRSGLKSRSKQVRLRLEVMRPEDTGLLLQRPRGGVSSGEASVLEASFFPDVMVQSSVDPLVETVGAPPMNSQSSDDASGSVDKSLTRVERKCRKLLARVLRSEADKCQAQEAGIGGISGSLLGQQHRFTSSTHLVSGNYHQGLTVPKYPPRLTYAVIRILGKGRCEEGAAVLSEVGGSSSSVGPSSVGRSIPMVVIGFVTSGYPRGLPGGSYPGGMSLCNASFYRDEGWQDNTRIRAWICNPGSTSLRRVTINFLSIKPDSSGLQGLVVL